MLIKQASTCYYLLDLYNIAHPIYFKPVKLSDTDQSHILCLKVNGASGLAGNDALPESLGQFSLCLSYLSKNY